jgi:hypothetical protein
VLVGVIVGVGVGVGVSVRVLVAVSVGVGVPVGVGVGVNVPVGATVFVDIGVGVSVPSNQCHSRYPTTRTIAAMHRKGTTIATITRIAFTKGLVNKGLVNLLPRFS